MLRDGGVRSGALVVNENGPGSDDASFTLLRYVRFPLMTGRELRGLVGVNDHLSFSSAWMVTLRSLVQEAFEYHKRYERESSLLDPSIFVEGVLDRNLQNFDGALRFKERCPSGCVPLIFMYDGDTNGVLHFIATRYGTQPWSNPVAAGLVSITSSSPLSRFSDPRALVGRNFSRLNFAGPRRSSNGGIESWWEIDLGEARSLRCTRYSLRHDASADYLRDWQFQGSADANAWETLATHANDPTVRMPGQYASWPIRDPLRRTFRYFRIIQTVPNPLVPNPTHVSLAHVELYGDFFFRS